MFPLAAIFAGISIAATAACWLFDSMTEKEKKRHDELDSELSELKNKFNLQIDSHNKNMYERLMNGINDICKQLLELAAENATADLFETDDSLGEIIVNKQSILNTIKQVK